MDEATKLLRRILETETCSFAWFRLIYDVIAHLAAQEAPPAEAPRDMLREAIENNRRVLGLSAAAQPAPLLGPPREPTPAMIAAVRDVDLVAVGWEGGLRQIWRDMFDAAMQGEGDCVIAPNPPDTDAAAKGLSRAGDDGLRSRPKEWLIERGQREGESLTHWYRAEPYPAQGQWVTDANKATRFASFSLAEKCVQEKHLVFCRTTEHLWVDDARGTEPANE